MTLRLIGAQGGYVELDAPAVGDGQRYELPGDVGIPAGAVMQFAGNVAPAGWLKANGAAISRTTYPRLWAWAQASGNLAASEGAKQAGQFGPGDGSTTFTVPDLRGEFVRGWDDGRGVDTGRAVGSAQTDQLQGHRHGSGVYAEWNANGNYGSTTSLPASWQSYVTFTQGWSSLPEEKSGDGFGATRYGAETRPRNVALLYCIKV